MKWPAAPPTTAPLRQPAAAAGAGDNAVAASSTPAAMTIDFMKSSPLRPPALTANAGALSRFRVPLTPARRQITQWSWFSPATLACPPASPYYANDGDPGAKMRRRLGGGNRLRLVAADR